MSSVYFGNANKQTWIKSPSSGMQAGSSGLVLESQLLSGSTFIKRSKASHRRFDMSWLGNLNDSDITTSLQTIKDFSDGVYGEGPFFWNDPYALKSNMFSPSWASPAISLDGDWADIFPDTVIIDSQKVTTASASALVGTNSQGYPTYTARYSVLEGDSAESNRFTFYIPEGYTLWLGFHGHLDAASQAVATPYNASGVAGTPVNLTALGVNSSVRVNSSYASTIARKVEFHLQNTGTDAAVMHVSGLIAQLLPTGTTPETGGFLSGRGTLGLQFANFPQIEYYSANINNGQIGMSLTLAEV